MTYPANGRSVQNQHQATSRGMFIDALCGNKYSSICHSKLGYFCFLFFFFVAGAGIRWDDNMYLSVRSRKKLKSVDNNLTDFSATVAYM